MHDTEKKGASSRILVVEDDAADSKLLQRILKDAGYRVQHAADGKRALRAIAKRRPDLILADFVMPVLSGAEMCSRLKSDPQARDIPVLFISSSGDLARKEAAFAAGAADYITKPFEAVDVLARMDVHLRLSRLHRDLAAEAAERESVALALGRSEANFRRLFENAPIAYQSLDIDGRFLAVNRAWTEMMGGYETDEIIGRSFQDYLVEEGFVARNLPRFLSSGEIELPGTRMQCRDGSEKTVDIVGRLGYDKGGDFLQTHCMLIDVTEKQRLLEERLKVAKLESIGVLAGGIAHDLNNYLTSITGGISLARIEDDSSARDALLEAAEGELQRIQNLTHRLLTFADGGSPFIATLDIGALVVESTNFALSGSNSRCEFDIPPDPPVIEVDEGQISQVIGNIVLNAEQAMPNGGTIHVSLAETTIAVERELPLAPGRYVRIAIEDHGHGIPEAERSKVFDPFFTTKPEGSGLGLSTAYSIVQRHHGYISLESEVDGGACFHVYLPVTRGTVADTGTAARDLVGGRGRVLVMDDEPGIRDVVVKMLQRLGYDAAACDDGGAMLAQYGEAMSTDASFDLVILDLTVPGGVGGREAIVRLKKLDPNAKAIVVSGYSNDSVMSNYREHGFAAAISKPFRLNTLSRVVGEVLRA